MAGQRIEAVKKRKEFLEAYRLAWQSFKEGDRDVIWPVGTYWMSHHAGCPSVPPG